MASDESKDAIRDRVKDKYSQAVLRVIATDDAGCCGTASSLGCADPITSNLYDAGQTCGLPQEAMAASLIRRSVELWIGCVAGALEEREYRDKVTAAGFEAIDVEPTRVYQVGDARAFLAKAGIDADAIAPEVEGTFMSAFVRARKPAS